MKSIPVLNVTFLVLFFVSCAKVPITERKQLKLLPEDQLISMSKTSYEQFLADAKVLPVTDARAQRVMNIGNKIKEAATEY